MGIQILGNSGTVAEVEVASRAQRITTRPIDVGALGSYVVDTMTGTMAAGLAAAAPVYSFRWGSTNTALIRSITLSMASLGTAFTAGVGIFDIIVARSFTVADTGGTSILPTGNSNKLRTSFATTLVSDLRQSSTATLTAGTRTLDGAAFAAQMFAVTAVANTVMLPSTQIVLPDAAGKWPLVLAQNEGFVVRATVPATGTWQMRVAVAWDEVSSF
jgi:hypothetical protein